MKWKCKTWKYSLLHNSKGLLIAARRSSRTPAAAVFAFTTITRRNSDIGGPRVSKKRRLETRACFAGRFRVCLALQHFAPREMGLFSGFTGRAAACGVAIVLCHFTGDSHHYTRACWRQSTRRCWQHSKCMIFSLVQTNRFKRSV